MPGADLQPVAFNVSLYIKSKYPNYIFCKIFIHTTQYIIVTFKFNFFIFMYSSIFVIGWKGKTDVPKLVEKYLNKKLPLDDFVTHEFPFEKINEVIRMLHSGEW